jgi:uncharacterized protein (TIGR03084 family)
VDPILTALAEQQAELTGLLDGLDDAGWHAPTRCEGWDVADVVLHLAQTNEMAIGSAQGRFAESVAELSAGLQGGGGGAGSATPVDDGAAMLVALERGAPTSELFARWRDGAATLSDLLAAMDLHTRVTWVAGELSARTLATTRLAETWIHTGDVAGALGVELPATDRLRQIARLAWRTLPYAFASAGLTMAGPVAFHLVGPDGDAWDFAPDEPALTTVSGPATELCAVAARRVDPAATSLVGEGPDAGQVLALVRTYAV